MRYRLMCKSFDGPWMQTAGTETDDFHLCADWFQKHLFSDDLRAMVTADGVVIYEFRQHRLC